MRKHVTIWRIEGDQGRGPWHTLDNNDENVKYAACRYMHHTMGMDWDQIVRIDPSNHPAPSNEMRAFNTKWASDKVYGVPNLSLLSVWFTPKFRKALAAVWPDGRLVRYRVPAEFAVIDRSQACFDKSMAHVVERRQINFEAHARQRKRITQALTKVSLGVE